MQAWVFGLQGTCDSQDNSTGLTCRATATYIDRDVNFAKEFNSVQGASDQLLISFDWEILFE